MVTVGWPPTVTRGLGTVGCACPPCAQVTVAPTCTRKPGMILSRPGDLMRSYLRSAPTEQSLLLDNHQRAVVDGNGWARHDDAGAFAVLYVNAGVVHDDGGAGGALQHDPTGGTRQVAYHDSVL